MTQPAPIHGDTMKLAAMVLRLADVPALNRSPLGRRLQEGVLRLLDHVILALAGFDRKQHLIAADAELQTLRGQLLLALEMEWLEEESFLALAEIAHQVGRQLGGWIKKTHAQSG
ncbi:MAG: four helix bundle protein [Magnetococcales bacterium]|nr:four helix bundle protein [Magnetococcales bacterium]